MKRTYHSIFWVFSALYIFDYLIDEFPLQKALGYTLFETVVLIAGFYANLLFLIPRFWMRGKSVIYLLSLIALVATSFCLYYLSGLDSVLLSESFTRAVISFILNYSFFLFISFMVWYFEKYSEERIKALQLEKEKLHLEITVLKSQISPHFLFNTLNNIYSLAVRKDENTPKMIAATSDILRYYASHGNQPFVPLVDELKILEQFVEVQKMRKLQGSITLSLPDSNQLRGNHIPPLVLLTLLENAFKHGDIGTNKKGYVSLTLEKKNDDISVVLENSYELQKRDLGVGQENVKSQLEILLGNTFEWSVRDEHPIYKVSLKWKPNEP